MIECHLSNLAVSSNSSLSFHHPSSCCLLSHDPARVIESLLPLAVDPPRPPLGIGPFLRPSEQRFQLQFSLAAAVVIIIIIRSFICNRALLSFVNLTFFLLPDPTGNLAWRTDDLASERAKSQSFL